MVIQPIENDACKKLSVSYALKLFQPLSMTSWFGTLFTKFGKILVSGSTLEAHRHYKIHFGMEIFAATPSRVCRQNMNAKFMCQKMAYRPFFGLPIQKWAKIMFFDQNFNFRDQIAEE